MLEIHNSITDALLKKIQNINLLAQKMEEGEEGVFENETAMFVVVELLLELVKVQTEWHGF